ncbi:hypothetical protein I4U23_015796 [Adineta vaga]|nr:hypothetical protein I4U23_015796 [Adineta vaga]
MLLQWRSFELVNITIDPRVGSVIPPDPLIISRFSSDTKVENIVSQLFTEDWINTINFSSYYYQCSPSECTYTYEQRFNQAYIIATIFVMGIAVVIIDTILNGIVDDSDVVSKSVVDTAVIVKLVVDIVVVVVVVVVVNVGNDENSVILIKANSISGFLPTIITSLEYTNAQAQLYSVPPYVCVAVPLLLSWVSNNEPDGSQRAVSLGMLNTMG